MKLFLDNNVLIGYIFETDNWNENSYLYHILHTVSTVCMLLYIVPDIV